MQGHMHCVLTVKLWAVIRQYSGKLDMSVEEFKFEHIPGPAAVPAILHHRETIRPAQADPSLLGQVGTKIINA